MQINNINSQNFNGYKNVISKKVIVPDNRCFTFLSMQLDNTAHSDLAAWKEIQRNLLNIKEPNDILTVEAFESLGENALYLSNIPLNPYSCKPGSNNETFMMKLYTLLASLAKRLMNDSNLIRDNGFSKTCSLTLNNLSPIFNNNLPVAGIFLSSALHSDNHPQENAASIMKVINKIMAHYFD